MSTPADHQTLEVVVAGGGVAGVEAVMALHALAGDRVHVTLLAPGPELVYRPMAVAEPFGFGSPRRYELDAIAADFGAELVVDALERVDGAARRAHTRAGRELAYDVLVLALGARPRPAWEHVVTFAGSSDAQAVRSVVTSVENGSVGSVAFVVPSGVAWSLPAYELALMTAGRARKEGHSPELVIYTPEREPLAAFGHQASREVESVLDRAGVRLVRAVTAEVTPGGELVVPFEETPLRFERVIALPRLEGTAPAGVPCDRDGFIPVDGHGAVRGEDAVYAAGDGTDFAIKQGGIAAAQADAVAESIAQRAGVQIDPRPFVPTLQGKLLTGDDARFLRAEPGSGGAAVSTASSTPLWWPGTKVAARYLAPYLAVQDAAAGVTEPAQPVAGVHELVDLPGDFENNPWGE